MVAGEADQQPQPGRPHHAPHAADDDHHQLGQEEHVLPGDGERRAAHHHPGKAGKPGVDAQR